MGLWVVGVIPAFCKKNMYPQWIKKIYEKRKKNNLEGEIERNKSRIRKKEEEGKPIILKKKSSRRNIYIYWKEKLKEYWKKK